MAGDLEDRLADALAEAVVRSARSRGALAKSGSGDLRKAARKAAREVMTELVTPQMVKLANFADRVEFLEQQQAAWAANGGGRRG